jgi:hypothetical protein
MMRGPGAVGWAKHPRVAGGAESGQLGLVPSPAFRLAAGLLAMAAVLPGAAAVRQVTVGAAPVERAAQVVSLTLPRELASGAILRDAAGQVVPLQAEADLTAKFIVARQAAGQVLRYTLEAGRLPDQGNVQVTEEPSPPRPGNTPGIASATAPSRIQAKAGRLRVSVGGRPIFYYQMDRDAVPRDDIDPKWRRAGYLHPVLTPGGFATTAGISSEEAPFGPGRPVDPGISARGPLTLRETSRGFDFSRAGEVTAPLEFGDIDTTWSGPVHGGFTSWERWVEDKGANSAVLVNESWEVTAYSVPKSVGEINLLDLAITQTNATTIPVNFGMRGLNVVGSSVWGKSEPDAKSSDPIFTDTAAPGGKLRWLGMTGPGKDRPAGIAVLFPAPGSEGYGINPLSPSITAPDPGGSFALAPNAREKLSYRIVTFDGPPDPALLEALWNGYTVTPVVTLGAP